uniref:NADH-ubiquinone oxidoreductase chain 2 n=1 Tax=Doliolum nationalis TaxID=76841 RepID=Q5KT39_DOLNA|nr:NADH dehydrogenase subunit 2 [Doliolum nationalis]
MVSNLLFLVVFSSGALVLTLSTSFMWMWLGMELLSLGVAIFVLMSHYDSEMGGKKGTAILKYLMVQFVAGGMVLGSLLLSEEWWQIMLAVALSLKMGLVPLHTWVVDILGALDLWEGFYLGVISKVGPFVLMACWLPSDWMYPLGVVSIIGGSLMGMMYSDSRHILACSSIMGTGWVVIVLGQGPEMVLTSIYLYGVHTMTLLWTTRAIRMASLSSWGQRDLYKSMGMGALLMANLGLPTYAFFVLKLYVVLDTKWYFLLLTTLLASGVSLIWYSRMINVAWMKDGCFVPQLNPGSLSMKIHRKTGQMITVGLLFLLCF